MIPEVKLSEETAKDPADATLLNEVVGAPARGKVYQTYSEYGGLKFTLVTTSKELHLMLGKLSKRGIGLLCEFLEEQFRATCSGEILVSFEKKDVEAGRPMLVTTAGYAEHEFRTFHLSAA